MKPQEFLETERVPGMPRFNLLGHMTRAVANSVYARGILRTPIPATSRNAWEYSKLLFPDFRTPEDAFRFVQSRQLVVDIGSGLTHLTPYSLISRSARENGDDSRMVGIEPRTGYPVDEEGGFSSSNLAKQMIADMLQHFARRLTLRPVHHDLPAEKHTLPCDAARLPLETGSADQVLSSFCYPWWVDDDHLAPIFREGTRILRPGGQMRLAPMDPRGVTRLKGNDDVAETLVTHYDDVSLMRTKNVWASLLAHRWPTMILTKKDA
jgi:SAM-dependent methyltransferase